MSYSLKSIILLIFLLSLSPTESLRAAAPGPSMVKTKGRVLLVKDRKDNGKLQEEKSFVIKGVCWSPVSIGTANDYGSRVEAFGHWYRKDIDLISRMNANTVYTFLDFGTDQKAFEVLAALHQHKIKAIVTVDVEGTNNVQQIKEVVSKYKEHPAILMWAIGNEWNINLYHGKFSSLLEAAKATEEAARLIKTLDKNHPVASIFGDITIKHAQISTSVIVNEIAPSVDVWGLNIYRGDNFGDLFDYWKAISSKPIFISEFGTDSFYSRSWWPARGREDGGMQKTFISSLWKDLRDNLSACNPQNVALGGTVFEWVDEWWKVKISNDGNNYRQDTNGFPSTWNKFAHPDGFANEEYFGIVRIDRTPKPIYDELKHLYSLDPCSYAAQRKLEDGVTFRPFKSPHFDPS